MTVPFHVRTNKKALVIASPAFVLRGEAIAYHVTIRQTNPAILDSLN
jgi:hypothetical protein